MSRNASGTYTLPTGNPVVSGTDITVTWGNNTMNDIATEMTDSLSRSGKGGMLAPLTFVDGSVTVPGISWVSDANTGFYRIGADNMAMTAGGVQIVDYANNAFTFSGTTDTAATGPIFSIFRNSASPADADLIGDLRFDGEDSAGNKTTYASVSSQIDDVTNATEDGTLLVKTMTAGTLTTQLDISSALVNITPATTIAGLTTIASLKGTGAVTITDILDEDNMASNSATKLATQQSIKAYVDSSVGAYDTLSEVLANGNTSGSTDLVMISGQKITTNTIDETTSASGVTIDSVLVKDSTVKAGTLTIGAGSITDSSGAITFGNENLTTTGNLDANGVEFDSLSGTGAVAITDIKDEDNMASNSATMLATQQSIKSYVDAQVGTVDTLSEVLAIGNTTGGTDVSVSTDDKVQFRDAAIYINSSTDGQLDIVADTEIQIAATTIDINGAVALNGALTGITDITASGVITGGTVEATTDTAAGDNAAMGYTAAEGLILTGQGSSSDVTIKNDADATVMSIATGTTNTTFAGDVDIGGDADTGLTLVGANNLGIQTGGTTRFNVDSIGKAIFTNRMVGNDGSAALPAFGFTSDANTGMYRVGSDSLGFSTGSTNRLTIDSTGDATFSGDINFSGATPNIILDADNDRLVVSGGDATSSGANIIFYGDNHASNADKMIFRNSSTTALTINASQNATFAGDVIINAAVAQRSGFSNELQISGGAPTISLSDSGYSTHNHFISVDRQFFAIGRMDNGTGANPAEYLQFDATSNNATFAGEIRADYASANIIAEFGGTGETGQIGFSFTGTDVGGLDYAYNTRTTVGMRAWTPNSYPITIDAGGGSSSSNKIFFKTNTSTTALTISSTDTATFAGAISKASGSFKIPHPLPELNETHNLVHSFVESPRAENLYSGMATLVDGTASVNIDTHSGMTEGTFEALNTLLTHSSSNESGYSPVKCSVVNNVITINCQDATSTDKVYWEVRGERKDAHMLDTEWTDDEGHVIVEPEVPSAATGEVFTPAIEEVTTERQVMETVETGSYVNLAGETIVETEQRGVTTETTETVVQRQDIDGVSTEVEVEVTTQVPTMETVITTAAVEEIIHSTNVVQPDTLEDGQQWRETIDS